MNEGTDRVETERGWVTFRAGSGSVSERCDQQAQLRKIRDLDLLKTGLETRAFQILHAHKAASEEIPQADIGLSKIKERPLYRRLPQSFWDAYENEAREGMHGATRRAFFIAAYAEFEYSLRELARFAKKILNVKLSPKDMNGRGVRKFGAFLRKAADVPIPDGDDWERICVLGIIRNAAAHSQGTIENGKDLSSIRRLIPEDDGKGHKGLSIGADDELVFGQGFLGYVVGRVLTFYSQCVKAVAEKAELDVQYLPMYGDCDPDPLNL